MKLYVSSTTWNPQLVQIWNKANTTRVDWHSLLKMSAILHEKVLSQRTTMERTFVWSLLSRALDQGFPTFFWPYTPSAFRQMSMGGGTFFKVGGGTSARWKEIIAKFVFWIGNCDVTCIEIWRHYLFTTWRSKLHDFRQNYTTMKTYRWTTWNSKRLLQRRARSSASLELLILFILTDWIKPFDACATEISICFHSGWQYRCPVTLCKNKREILMITSPLSSNVRHREMITPQWRF